MENVKLEIDGRTMEVEQGTTVLQAARSIGIKIPTLCDDERLEAYGGCRMCMVEIETKWGRKRLVTSCVYPVEEGLKVQTNTEKIKIPLNKKTFLKVILFISFLLLLLDNLLPGQFDDENQPEARDHSRRVLPVAY